MDYIILVYPFQLLQLPLSRPAILLILLLFIDAIARPIFPYTLCQTIPFITE